MHSTEVCRQLRAFALAVGRCSFAGATQGPAVIGGPEEAAMQEAARDVLSAWLGRPATDDEMRRVLCYPPHYPSPEQPVETTDEW